jgi:uncharacterized LabA/DUF88 family protein
VDQYAIFVDAGFVYAAAGSHLGADFRSDVALDFAEVRTGLIEVAEKIAGLKTLLRIYWYDGATDRIPQPPHRVLAELPNLKVRLGTLRRSKGGALEQKGVDALLVRDLIVLALERGVTDVVLVAGDEDLREGMTEAQIRGLRVHLLSFDTPRTELSRELRFEADTTEVLPGAFFSGRASRRVRTSFEIPNEPGHGVIVRLEEHHGFLRNVRGDYYFDRNSVDREGGCDWDSLAMGDRMQFDPDKEPDSLTKRGGRGRNVRVARAMKVGATIGEVSPNLARLADGLERLTDLREGDSERPPSTPGPERRHLGTRDD